MGELDPDEAIADAIAEAIIRRLMNAGGFDHWWYKIDWVVREHLVESIIDTVRRELNIQTRAFTATNGDSIKGWIA